MKNDSAENQWWHSYKILVFQILNGGDYSHIDDRQQR